MSANRKEEVGKKYCERKKKQNTEKNWVKIRLSVSKLARMRHIQQTYQVFKPHLAEATDGT